MADSGTPPLETLLRQRAWLVRTAASLVVDATAADDVAQQALLLALERPPAHAAHPRAWLAAVARNVARRFGAGERLRADHERRASRPERLPATDEVVARAALQHDVSSAVLALEEPYRTTLLLRFFEDLKPAAIAARTDAPVETVRTRLKRGLELLRARLIARRGGTVGEWAVGLIGMLDPRTLRAVRRIVLARGAEVGAGATTSAVASISALGTLGVIAMSTKLKLAAAAVLVAGGAFAVIKLRDAGVPVGIGDSPAAHAAASQLAEPASSPELPQPAEATRATEPERKADVAPKSSAPEAAATSVERCVVEAIVRRPDGQVVPSAIVLLEAANSGGFGTVSELCGNAPQFLDAVEEPDSKSSEKQSRHRRAVADASGAVRFDSLTAGELVNVAALHPEEGVAVVAGIHVDASTSPTKVELTLEPGVILSGQVTDSQGVGIPGAEVAIMRYFERSGSSTSMSLQSVRADAEGRYKTIPLPYRGFRLTAYADGYLRDSSKVNELPESERAHRVDFRLMRAIPRRGRVLAADGHEAKLSTVALPLAVILSDGDPSSVYATRDSLGQEGSLDLARDLYEVTPHYGRERYVSIWSGQKLLGSATLAEIDPAIARDFAEGPDLLVDLAKLPAPPVHSSLRIEVVSAENGKPVAPCDVEVTRDPTMTADPAKTQPKKQTFAAVGDGGCFEISDLEVGSYDLSVQSAGFAACWRSVLVTAPASTTRIELRRANAHLTGEVVDENGVALAGAKVFLADADGRSSLAYRESNAVTDADGRFRFDPIPEGNYLVVAESEGLAPASVAATASTRPASPDAPLAARLRLVRGFEIRIDAFVAGVTATGPFSYRIRDERGAAVHDDHRPSSITTRTGGGFPFRVAPGDYTLEVYSPLYETATTSFVARPGAVVTVDLTRRE